MAAKRRDHLIVAGRQERAPVHPIGTVVPLLDLAFGVPAGIVAEDCDEGRAARRTAVSNSDM
ncbi:MAG: hypothetical protein R3D44_05140 [Hyphomicrobiaceae bacterium]